jgi:hypothetical protein
MKKLWLKFKNTDFFQTYKEEMIGIPILILMFYSINFLFISLFPNGSFFDFASQMETLFFNILTYLISIWISHFMIRITFPNIYKHLHKIYHNFEYLRIKDKNIYAFATLFISILAAAIIFT